MKKPSVITASIGVCLLASSTFAATININPGDNVVSRLESAADGDVVRIAAGVYSNVGKIKTQADITVVGVPFENSGDPADIDEVLVEFDNSSDNWVAAGVTTVRGIKFAKGDHQIVAENEILVEYCTFEEGADQVSFNKPGYGTLRYNTFLLSGDDGVDMDSNANVDGAFFDIHHNVFEQSREDGIEFRTYERKNFNTIMPVEIHHNTFIECGIDDEGDGGDSIQIIDQEMNGVITREILIYNNIIDGRGQARSGIGCNDKNRHRSTAQIQHTGAHQLEEPIWIYNNTIVNHKGTAIAGGNNTWAFNNIIQDCEYGFARVEARNNMIDGVPNGQLWLNDTVDAGSNLRADPQLNADYELTSGSPALGAGLTTFTGGGLTITPEHDDLGAIAGAGSGSGLVRFSSSVLVKTAAQVGDAYAGSIANDAFDPDGDAMTFSVLSGPAWLSVAANGRLSGTPTDADVGENRWDVQVVTVDSSDTATLSIDVFGAAVQLVADAGADITLVAVSGTASAALNASGSMGNIVEYLWLENGQVLGSGEVRDQEFDVGTHVVTLQVTDVDGNVDTDELTVTVLPEDTGDNIAPTFKNRVVFSTRTRIGRELRKDISGKATDADGDTLTFSLVNGPNWLTVTPDGVLIGTPTAADRGRNLFTIMVSDGEGGTDTAGIKVRVR